MARQEAHRDVYIGLLGRVYETLVRKVGNHNQQDANPSVEATERTPAFQPTGFADAIPRILEQGLLRSRLS
jgi:hypothetical protein